MAFADVTRLRKEYIDYLDNKRGEIDEQRQSRRYQHADHWTASELKTLKRRNQPPVTSNVGARKINSVVGLLERMRQDPKAFPRTPKHQEGADLATAVLKYVLDDQDWQAISPECARHGAIDGIGGLELGIEPGPDGDNEITLGVVEPETYFYDPRSFRPDFSDARYMGVAKWADVEMAKEMFPDKADILDGLMTGQDYGMAAGDQDRERKWIDTNFKRVRLVEHWYKSAGKWYWCYHVGWTVLEQGISPFLGEKGETIPRYIMFSAYVDHEGDRYGFWRNMKSPQDEINHHKSKAIHILSSRKIIADRGAVDDVAKAKAEWAKADGWVVKNKGFDLEPERRELDFQGQMLFLEKAEKEISTLAPDPAALTGDGERKVQSGRAIALLQAAGMAELGPFIIAHRGWKIRVYRAIWNTLKRVWQAERWIRVTDDEEVANFIQINGFEIDPVRGPVMVNQLGQLDVDIILDEGPDTINMMQDALETALQSGVQLPPDILLELLPLQSSVKKRLQEKMQQASQPTPPQQQEMMLQLEKLAAEVAKLQSEALLNERRAGSEGQAEPQGYEPPPELQNAKLMAEIEATDAKAQQSRMAALKQRQDAMLAPVQMQMDFANRNAQAEQRQAA